MSLPEPIEIRRLTRARQDAHTFTVGGESFTSIGTTIPRADGPRADGPRAADESAVNGYGSGLLVRWADLSEHVLDSRFLRKFCPCAECQERRVQSKEQSNADAGSSKRSSRLRVIKSSLETELNLVQVFPVGNYAVGIEWGDGHNSGIFSFEYLYVLATSRHGALDAHCL